ncbi:MAG: tetratricopeptide repeat protein [Silvanigrellales bacterium]|nr:tetratricopeptide repeat protein [Silvanigrellales bacterium]
MKTRRKARIVSLVVFLGTVVPASTLVVSCGSDNLFEPLAKKDEKDKGKNALQDGDYDTAIASLEDHLAKNPDDVEARSMLANAYMAKAGMNQIKLAAEVASSKGDNWSTIVGAMPDGTSENVAALNAAVRTLAAIPAGSRTPEQSYQLALAQASLAVTITKKAAGDGTSVTDAKVDTMSDADAELAYSTLKGSKETVTSDPTLSQNAGAQKLAALSDKIAEAEGATDADKMKAFLKGTN